LKLHVKNFAVQKFEIQNAHAGISSMINNVILKLQISSLYENELPILVKKIKKSLSSTNLKHLSNIINQKLIEGPCRPDGDTFLSVKSISSTYP